MPLFNNPFDRQRTQLPREEASRISKKLGGEGLRLRRRLEKAGGEVKDNISPLSTETVDLFRPEVQQRREIIEQALRLFEPVRQTIQKIEMGKPERDKANIELLKEYHEMHFPYDDILEEIKEGADCADHVEQLYLAYLATHQKERARDTLRIANETSVPLEDRGAFALMIEFVELLIDPPLVSSKRELVAINTRFESALLEHTEDFNTSYLHALEILLKGYVGTMSPEVYKAFLNTLEQCRTSCEDNSAALESIYKSTPLLHQKAGHLDDAQRALAQIRNTSGWGDIALTLAEDARMEPAARAELLIEISQVAHSADTAPKQAQQRARLIDATLAHPDAYRLLTQFEEALTKPLDLNSAVCVQGIMTGYAKLQSTTDIERCCRDIEEAYTAVPAVQAIQQDKASLYIEAGCAVARAQLLAKKDHLATIQELVDTIFTPENTLTESYAGRWLPTTFQPLIDLLIECDIDPAPRLHGLNKLAEAEYDWRKDALLLNNITSEVKWAAKRAKQILKDADVYAHS